MRANPDVRKLIAEGKYPDAFRYFSAHNDEPRFQYAPENVKENRKRIIPPGEEKDLLELIDIPVEDLSLQMGDDFAGIYAAKGFSSERKIGIGKAFLDRAEEYHRGNFYPKGIAVNLKRCLDASDVEFSNPTIFDMGSGSGNSVFACTELFPACRIIASDLSPYLLRILVRVNREEYQNRPILALASDALTVKMRQNSFQLVTGNSMLHHLVNPEHAFTLAYNMLTKDGCAIFFEPFMSGVLAANWGFKQILRANEFASEKLSEKTIRMLTGIGEDIKYRIVAHDEIPDDRNPIHRMDDKWIFDRESIVAMAESAGFKKARVISLDSPKFFTDYLRAIFAWSNESIDTLPAWAYDMVSLQDTHNYRCGRNDVILWGGIILQK